MKQENYIREKVILDWAASMRPYTAGIIMPLFKDKDHFDQRSELIQQSR